MTKISDREKLARKLYGVIEGKVPFREEDWILLENKMAIYRGIADFILADRKRIIEEYKVAYFCNCDSDRVSNDDIRKAEIRRIVEPLVKHKKLWCGNWNEYTASQCIEETLRLALGEEENE